MSIQIEKEPRIELIFVFLENEYKQWLLQNLRTGGATFDRLKKSFQELHELKLYEISPFLIEKWRSRRQKDGMKPASINRDLLI